LKNQSTFDVIIVGGGLAGLTCALHLSDKKKQVLLIEKNSFPKHKVCGEYISNEVLPYLNSLGINPVQQGAKQISKVQLSTVKSNTINGTLPLGGFGMSRYCIDKLMADKAIENGVDILQETVEEINFQEDIFSVKTKSNQEFFGRVVIGAFGKRSNLDVKMQRDFIQKKSPYLAVKMHVKGDFPEDLVALHNFKGGYCGVSKVETDAINLCYIANFSTFKKFKNIEEFQKEVVFKNDYLDTIFKNSEPIFEKPLTISQISFETKNPVEDHVLMCGDTAGMIHPLCGNGMGMAIASAKIASEEVLRFLNGEISREQLENKYIRNWNKEFRIRLKAGHFIAWLFRNQRISEMLLSLLKWNPSLLPKIIRRTHGKPLQPI
jgi:flavin-dependent dehydrogenase